MSDKQMIMLFKEGERFYLEEAGVKALAKITTVNVFNPRTNEVPLSERGTTKAKAKALRKEVIWIRDKAGNVIGTK